MKREKILEKIRAFIMSEKTKKRFRKSEKAFTRSRKLPFPKLVIFTISKSVKSLQNRLNEFFSDLLDEFETVTGSAYTQARQKFTHEIFIAMNDECIVKGYYADEEYETFMGHCLIAIDGSKVYLPNSEDIRKEFGTIATANKQGKLGEYSSGLMSVMHDVLNDITIDSFIASHDSAERDLALKHLEKAIANAIHLYDRGYLSYEFFAIHLMRGQNALFRCKKNAFKAVEEFLKSDEKDKIVTIKKPNWSKVRTPKTSNLPDEITVRLVKVFLDSGEIEILATTLLDQQMYPTEIFKDLYWKRWGVETNYDIIKERLDLENFTGQTSESVKQDFYATVFLSNLESILTKEANEILHVQSANNKNNVKVNKAVSFNAIKNHALELLWDNNIDLNQLMEKLTLLFLSNPTPIRENRNFPRKTTARKSINYYKRRKKYTY